MIRKKIPVFFSILEISETNFISSQPQFEQTNSFFISNHLIKKRDTQRAYLFQNVLPLFVATQNTFNRYVKGRYCFDKRIPIKDILLCSNNTIRYIENFVKFFAKK